MTSQFNEQDDPTNLRPMREMSKAPIADKEDWANLMGLLRDRRGWSLETGDQQKQKVGTSSAATVTPAPTEGNMSARSAAASAAGGAGGGPTEIAGGSGVVASLTHGSQSLTRELLHRRVLSELTSASTGAGAAGHRAAMDPKAVYDISLDGLRLCNLGVNPKGSSAKELSDVARASALSEFRDVRRLSVNNNKIQSSVAIECVLPCLPELRELQLDFNMLDQLPQVNACAKLEQLTAVHNAMTTLGDTIFAQRLTTIDLTANRLTSMPESMRLPVLTTLTLRSNLLQSLESLSSLIHLTSLDVSSNELTSLSGIDTMVNLTELSAADNQLRQSAIQAHKNPLRALAPKLESLDLSNNRISSLNFFPTCGFPKLWNLNVAHNAFHGEKTQRAQVGTPPPAGKKGSSSLTSTVIEGKQKQKKKPSKDKTKKKKRNNLGLGDDSDSSSGSSDLTDGLGDLDGDDFDESVYGEGDGLNEGEKKKTSSGEEDSPSKESASSKATAATTASKSGGGPTYTKGSVGLAGPGKNNATRLGPNAATAKPSSKASDTSASTRRPSTSSTAPTSTTPPAEPEVNFLSRITTLFPSLEALDLSNNSSDLVTDYSELTRLLPPAPKTSTLAEIGISGTLDMGPQRLKQHRDAIQAFMPDVRVVDGHELENAKMTVTDMTSVSASSRPGSARPMSSTGLRPTSALLKTATSKKNELSEFRDQLVTFLKDAEDTKGKCNNVIDFLDASVAWAFDGAEKPDEEAIIKYGRAGKPSAELVAEQERKELDDLENQLKCDETMAAIKAKQEKQQQDRDQQQKVGGGGNSGARASSSSSTTRTLVAKKPSTGGPVNSPGCQARLRASSSHSQVALTSAAANPSLRRATSDVHSVGTGGTGEKTRAMERMEKERKMNRPNFASEQKKFREQAKKESEDRLRQILEMTGKNHSSNSTMSRELVVQKHKKQVAEMGTSTFSPEGNKKRPATQQAKLTKQQLADEELLKKSESFLTRAMSSGGQRVSAGVGTSPEKTEEGSGKKQTGVPRLALKTTGTSSTGTDPAPAPGEVPGQEDDGEGEGAIPETLEDDVEFLLQQEDLDPNIKEMLLEERARRAVLLGDDDDDYYGGGGGSDDEEEDDTLIHVTGDPRFIQPTTTATSNKATPTSGTSANSAGGADFPLQTSNTTGGSGESGVGSEGTPTSSLSTVPSTVPLQKKNPTNTEVLRPNSASIRQRQEMGKSHKRLGATPTTHLEEGQKSNDSTAIAHQSLVLSRYTGGGSSSTGGGNIGGGGAYDAGGVNTRPGGFSLKKEVQKGASGLSSANMQPSSGSGGPPALSTTKAKAGGGASSVLKPQHMGGRQGATSSNSSNVMKDTTNLPSSSSGGGGDQQRPVGGAQSSTMGPAGSRAQQQQSTTTAQPTIVAAKKTQPYGLTQGGGGGVSLNRRQR